MPNVVPGYLARIAHPDSTPRYYAQISCPGACPETDAVLPSGLLLLSCLARQGAGRYNRKYAEVSCGSISSSSSRFPAGGRRGTSCAASCRPCRPFRRSRTIRDVPPHPWGYAGCGGRQANHGRDGCVGRCDGDAAGRMCSRGRSPLFGVGRRAYPRGDTVAGGYAVPLASRSGHAVCDAAASCPSTAASRGQDARFL